MTNQVLSPNDQLRTWFALEGAQSPVLLTGDYGEALRDIVDELVEWAQEGGLTGQADIVWCETEKATIAIAEVREVLHRLAFAAVMPRRVVIVPEAEKLSLPAANALLKSLEESAPETRYLLTTQWRRRLLPTILSRCQTIVLTEIDSPIQKQPSAILADSPMRRLGRAAEYKDEDIEQLIDELVARVREQGPSAELRLAMTRLRDYYRIKSERGNEKLAREVLVASLPIGKDT